MDRSKTSLVMVALLAAAVTACSDGGGSDRAETLPSASTTASPTPEPLTKKQIRARLLTIEDMPTGWAVTKAAESDRSSSTFTPSRCAVMAKKGKGVDLAEVTFDQGGMMGSRFSQEVYRPTDATPTGRLARLRATLASCSSYRVKDRTGTMRITLSALSFPKLGDGTLAVRGELKNSLVTATDDVVYVAVGRDVVRFDSVSVGSAMSGEQMEKLVRLGVERIRGA